MMEPMPTDSANQTELCHVLKQSGNTHKLGREKERESTVLADD